MTTRTARSSAARRAPDTRPGADHHAPARGGCQAPRTARPTPRAGVYAGASAGMPLRHGPQDSQVVSSAAFLRGRRGGTAAGVTEGDQGHEFLVLRGAHRGADADVPGGRSADPQRPEPLVPRAEDQVLHRRRHRQAVVRPHVRVRRLALEHGDRRRRGAQGGAAAVPDPAAGARHGAGVLPGPGFGSSHRRGGALQGLPLEHDEAPGLGEGTVGRPGGGLDAPLQQRPLDGQGFELVDAAARKDQVVRGHGGPPNLGLAAAERSPATPVGRSGRRPAPGPRRTAGPSRRGHRHLPPPRRWRAVGRTRCRAERHLWAV